MSNFKNFQWRSQSVKKSISQNNFTPVKTQLFQNNRINSNSVKQYLFQNNIAQSSQRNSFQNYYGNQKNISTDQQIYNGDRQRISRYNNSDQIIRRTGSAPKQIYQDYKRNKDIDQQNLNLKQFKNSFQEYNFPVQKKSEQYQRPSIDKRNSYTSSPLTKILRKNSYRQSFSSNNSISIQEYNKIREKTPEIRLIKPSEKKVDLNKYVNKNENLITAKFNQIVKILNQKAKDQIKRQFMQMQTEKRQILYMEYIIDKYKFFLEQKNFQNELQNNKTQNKKQEKIIQEQKVNIDEKENHTEMSSVYLDDQSPQNKQNIQSQEESFQSVIEQQKTDTLQSFHQSIQSEVVLENSNLRKNQIELPSEKKIKKQNSILSDTNLINFNNKTSNIFLKKNQNDFNRVLSPKNLKVYQDIQKQEKQSQQSNFQQKWIEILQNQTVKEEKQKKDMDVNNKINLQNYQIIIEDNFKDKLAKEKNDNNQQNKIHGDIDQIHSDNTEEIPLFSEDRIIEEQYEEEEEDERQALKMNQKLQLIQEFPSDHKRTFSFNELNIVQPQKSDQIKNELLNNHYKQIQNQQPKLFQKKKTLENQDIDLVLQQTNENLQTLLEEERALEQEKKNLMLLKEQIAKQKQEMQNIKHSTEKLDFDKLYDPKFVSNTSSQIRHLSESKRQNETLFSQPTTSRYKTQNQSISKIPKSHINYSYESRVLLTPNESVSKVRQTTNSNYRDSNIRNKFTESIIVDKQHYSDRLIFKFTKQ